MNQLINIIYLFVALKFILPKLGEMTQDPIYSKLLLVVTVLGLETVFDSLNKIIRGNKITLNGILDKSLMNSLLVLLGFLLFNDIKQSESIMSRVPGLSGVIDLITTKLFIMILPIIVFTTSKCFLKQY